MHDSDIVTRKRFHQKQFRAREKERSQAASNLLADTQQRLRQAEAQRSALQTRNKVLEGFIIAQTRPTAGLADAITPVTATARRQWQAAEHIPDVVQNLLLPTVKLTTRGGAVLHMGPDDIAHLPAATFASLYTAEVEQMRVRLREASTLHDRHHREQLVATTIEATSLVLSLGISNPTAMYHKAFISMADGSAVQHQTPENSLTLLALTGYSESQLQDMLAVRFLCFAQIGRLQRERNALLDRMATHSDQLANVKIWAERLQQTVCEEHEILAQNLVASYLGISTATQTAVGMVASYPLMLNHVILEHLAAHRGVPSMSDIVNQAALPPPASLTWNHVKTYVDSLSVDNMMTGVSFLGTVSRHTLCA